MYFFLKRFTGHRLLYLMIVSLFLITAPTEGLCKKKKKRNSQSSAIGGCMGIPVSENGKETLNGNGD